uniref:Uncharacterized protein n=1 Tax=Candidatus Kentrum sp. SD TaxID=2126332 RepID=A0A450YFD0_9GAMM|nr:MAG: hypothetical protein BECKSD772F_GA0070984_105612 [Candidatus Kentron sp. SD]VFK45734.1 MAG: hypothetical protein BECKSD772E_GA0070983_105912 [Candidatus Kentron sp. SD]
MTGQFVEITRRLNDFSRQITELSRQLGEMTGHFLNMSRQRTEAYRAGHDWTRLNGRNYEGPLSDIL